MNAIPALICLMAHYNTEIKAIKKIIVCTKVLRYPLFTPFKKMHWPVLRVYSRVLLIFIQLVDFKTVMLDEKIKYCQRCIQSICYTRSAFFNSVLSKWHVRVSLIDYTDRQWQQCCGHAIQSIEIRKYDYYNIFTSRGLPSMQCRMELSFLQHTTHLRTQHYTHAMWNNRANICNP